MNKPHKKERQSNFELLRIVAMFMVLIVHSDFQALGEPTHSELIQSPCYTVARILIESFAIVCVNTFVLISGWFGIKFSIRGLLNILFQCLFFTFFIYATLVLTNQIEFVIGDIKRCLMLTSNIWFVKCYLGLFIISPVLNAFVQHSERQVFITFLVIFFLFQTIYGWMFQATNYFEYGYSAMSFMGLYLLARYVAVYKPTFLPSKPEVNFIMYIFISILLCVCMLMMLYIDKPLQFHILWQYNNPLVIISSMFLLLAFRDLHIKSHSINWIASSCLGVYLLYFYNWDMFMAPFINRIIMVHNGGIGALIVFFSLILFFVVAIFIDKLRMALWNLILYKLPFKI